MHHHRASGQRSTPKKLDMEPHRFDTTSATERGNRDARGAKYVNARAARRNSEVDAFKERSVAQGHEFCSKGAR